MSSPRTIYLVRHGEITTDGRQRFIGQVDIPLNAAGLKQAACLRDHLAGVELVHVFCSDLGRSLATARIIGEKHGLEPVVRKDLREVGLGAWDGLTFEDVMTEHPEEFRQRGADIIHFRPPGGESFADCAQRVAGALAGILEGPEGDILLAGHAGVNRIIICLVLGMPLKNMFRIGQDYGCLNVLKDGTDGFKVVSMNVRCGGK
ncbi:MAG TPA: histidine phosphatase family protein [Spirochaetia bacterium]|nr:histidine phosphatase family protein [Spirochaetia bacterium]